MLVAQAEARRWKGWVGSDQPLHRVCSLLLMETQE